MASQTVLISLPKDLIAEIDATVGAERRAAFVLQTARAEPRRLKMQALSNGAEVRRRKMLEFLSSDEPAWKDEDHPDLVALGTGEWVRQLRREWDGRPSLDSASNKDGE